RYGAADRREARRRGRALADSNADRRARNRGRTSPTPGGGGRNRDRHGPGRDREGKGDVPSAGPVARNLRHEAREGGWLDRLDEESRRDREARARDDTVAGGSNEAFGRKRARGARPARGPGDTRMDPRQDRTRDARVATPSARSRSPGRPGAGNDRRRLRSTVRRHDRRSCRNAEAEAGGKSGDGSLRLVARRTSRARRALHVLMIRDLAWRILRGGAPVALREIDRAARENALDPRDRGLLRRIVGTEVRRRATLRAMRDRFAEGRPDADLSAILHVGFVQLFFLDQIPDHAAVGETVGVAREAFGPKKAGYVNAVLRA